MKDFGWKSALSIALFIIADAVPQVLPFRPYIITVATLLGGAGVTHRVIKDKAVKKKVAALEREVVVLNKSNEIQ